MLGHTEEVGVDHFMCDIALIRAAMSKSRQSVTPPVDPASPTPDHASHASGTAVLGDALLSFAVSMNQRSVPPDAFSHFFQTMPVALFFCSHNGTLLDLNEAAEFLIGRARADVVNHRDWSFEQLGIPPEQVGAVAQAWRERRSVRDIPIIISDADGHPRRLLKRFEPFTMNGVEGMLCIAHDVTERDATKNALQAAEERFSKAFRTSPLAMLL
ncbi:MAG: PAS domain-containing protein, partial [Thermomicrobiales bacterium]